MLRGRQPSRRSAALAGLTRLAVLRADRNHLADLWPVALLAGLELLDLGTNRIRNLQPLAGMVRLKVLPLDSNGRAEVFPLARLEGEGDSGASW